jgi:hypothetical protein
MGARMAVDFQVVFPQTTVPLNSVTVQPGLNPRSLSIIGQDFTSVAQVLINNIASPDIVILSKTRLLAQVPSQLQNATLAQVTVTSTSLTLSPKSLILFQIGPQAGKVSGILRLIQIFLKVLLTTPGRDIFAPRIGGAALKDIGLTFGADQGGGIVSDIIISVDTTRKQIMAIQARDPTIPRAERLLAATVLNANYNRAEAALVVGVQLTSQAGQAATANIMV